MSEDEKQFEAAWQAVEPAVNALAAEGRREAERPEEFWRAQRAAIRERLEEQERMGAQPLMRWAAALATLTLCAVLLPQPVAPPVISAERDPDHELLLGVERTMRRSVPRSLQAAEFLAAELNQAAQMQEKQN